MKNYIIENAILCGVSLVKNPAIEANFELVDNHIIGPLMIPNKKILRYFDEWFTVSFTEDCIKAMLEDIDAMEALQQINIEHTEITVMKNGWAQLTQVWIDKNGVLMANYKVLDSIILEAIESGELKGFSIEVYADVH